MHGIHSNDSMILARTSAWHGLGRVLPDTVTPAEALLTGGLSWTVEESTALTATFFPAEYREPHTPDRVVIDTHKSLRRSDDKTVLATVGADYSVLQNATLADIATSLGSEGKARVESAGSLFGGRKVFFLLHTDTLDIGRKGDTVQQYILLANAHDGTMSATVLPTSIRVVCNNTLTMALGAAKTAYRWRHTSGLSLRIEDIKAALATYRDAAKSDAEAMNALAAKPMTRDEIQSLWVDVLVALDGKIEANPRTEQEARRKQKAVDALAEMTRVFDTEARQFGATAWVAANAATNYIQFSRGNLKGDARVNSDLFGAYGDAKRTVMSKALALV